MSSLDTFDVFGRPANLPHTAAETWWSGAMCNSMWCV